MMEWTNANGLSTSIQNNPLNDKSIICKRRLHRDMCSMCDMDLCLTSFVAASARARERERERVAKTDAKEEDSKAEKGLINNAEQ